MEKLPFGVNDVKAFMESVVWKEILATLKERTSLYMVQILSAPMHNVHSQNEEGIKTTYGVEAIQGAVKEIDYLASLPDAIISDLQEGEGNEQS
jgi:hypothetical protein